jgi:hypothetical protein
MSAQRVADEQECVAALTTPVGDRFRRCCPAGLPEQSEQLRILAKVQNCSAW